MAEHQVIEMNELKRQVDRLWDDIVSLGKEYWRFYEDTFLSGEPNGHTKIKELYRQEELPF